MLGPCPRCGKRGATLVHLSEASVLCEACWNTLFVLSAGDEYDVDIDLTSPVRSQPRTG
jgi:hypothetical protein